VQLFEEAGRAQDRHAYDEACPKFAKVVELEPAKVGAKLALADCYEQQGKLASALAAYRAAAARSAQAGDPRRKRAEEKVAELETRAPHVRIDVPASLSSVAGLSVVYDGAPLDVSKWNVAVPADPGEHTVYVSAPGKRPWSGKVTVIAGAAAEVVLAGLEDLPPPLVLAPRSRGVPAWAWASGGVGLASGVVAIVFAAEQAAAQSQFNAQCKDSASPNVTSCDTQKGALWRDFGLALGFGAAGVATLAATIAIAGSPWRSPPPAPAHASFWMAPEGAGVALGGRF
jgi:hypothetical protein